MKNEKPCAKFNNYSCLCDYCHDCGWKKEDHSVAAPTERVETIPERFQCVHCGNRIYPEWRHHGSNMKPCYGGLDTEAEPAVAPSPAPAACNCRQFCICDAWAKPHCHYCKLNMESA